MRLLILQTNGCGYITVYLLRLAISFGLLAFLQHVCSNALIDLSKTWTRIFKCLGEPFLARADPYNPTISSVIVTGCT